MIRTLPYIVPASILVIFSLVLCIAHLFTYFQFWNYRFDHTIVAMIIFIIIDFVYKALVNIAYIHYYLFGGTLLLAIGSETSVIFEKGYQFAIIDILPIILYSVSSYVIFTIAKNKNFKYIRTLVVGLISNVVYFTREMKDWQETGYRWFDIDGYIYPMIIIIICGCVHTRCVTKKHELPK